MKLFWTVFGVALVVRAGVGLLQLNRCADATALEFPDEVQYWGMAASLARSEGLRDELGFRAGRMPMYPALLSLVANHPHGIILAKIGQWIVGALTAGLAALFAGALLGSHISWAAGIAVAVDPFLTFFGSLLLTETVVIAAILWLAWLLSPLVGTAGIHVRTRRWFAVAASAALCIYVRESAIFFVAAMLTFVAVLHRSQKEVLAPLALCTILVGISLLPWAIRNRLVIGEWRILTTRGGISLFDGLGPQATGASDLGDLKQMPAVQGLSEGDWDRYFRAESIRAMKADPLRIVRLAGIKLLRTWNPLPNVESYQSSWIRGLAAAWSLPTFAFALIGFVTLLVGSAGGDPLSQRSDLSTANPRSITPPDTNCVVEEGARVRPGRTATLFLMLPAICLSILHSVFVGSVRYRMPAVPFLDILAVWGAWIIVGRIVPGIFGREKHGFGA